MCKVNVAYQSFCRMFFFLFRFCVVLCAVCAKVDLNCSGFLSHIKNDDRFLGKGPPKKIGKL